LSGFGTFSPNLLYCSNNQLRNVFVGSVMIAFEQVLYHWRFLKQSVAIRNFDDARTHACGIIKNMFSSAPVLGIDLDGTIDESAEFFRTLTSVWPGTVVVITYRDNEDHAVDYLRRLGIYIDKVVLVDGLDKKAEAIKENGVDVYIDDQDECLQNIPG